MANKFQSASSSSVARATHGLDLGGTWRYKIADSNEFAETDWDDSAWSTMTIPQNWFLAGLDHHGVVWFRRAFASDLPAERHATLRFDGVDYFADVYLNGVHLGRHEGYFESFAFDVTAVLQSHNQLAVRVDSPLEPIGLDGWHMRKRLIKGVLNHHDCRPGGGWVASGQAYNTGGIWNRVTLHVHGPITVDRVLLQAELEAEPPALRGTLQMTNRGAATAVTLDLSCAPENFTGGDAYAAHITLDIPPGVSQHAISLPVPGVRRWQPWDRGFPHLYQFTIRSLQFAIHHATTFGFRSVKVDDDYRWWINGRRYFPRGSNYIASQWLSETLFPVPNRWAAAEDTPEAQPESWFERDVNLMRAANLNTIRVHAHMLPPEFHAACDRAGLLVWQDFPLQWGYSDAAVFHAEAERQARAMIAQLYNHPSIVAWCMHNESPWDADWMADEAGGSYDPTHNLALDQRLYQAARAADPTRHVQMNSGTGDSHVYPGWYYGHWRDYARGDHGAPFPTEYGAQGLPSLDAVRRTFARLGEDAGHAALMDFKVWLEAHPHWLLAKEMPPLDEVPPALREAYTVWETWRFHNFQPAETFYGAGIELGDSLEAFIANSQAYQNRITQFATETFRQHKYDKINGVMQFMFVEPWPAVTWAVLDYWRQPKPAFYMLKNAMQPVLVTAVLPPTLWSNRPWSFDLFVVNDLLDAFPRATCRWNIVQWEAGRMTQPAAGLHTFSLEPDSKTAPVTITAEPLASDEYNLVLTLHAGADLLSQNSYALQVSASTAKGEPQ